MLNIHNTTLPVIQLKQHTEYKEQPATFACCIQPADGNTLNWAVHYLPNGRQAYVFSFMSPRGRKKIMQCVENTAQHTLSLELRAFTQGAMTRASFVTEGQKLGLRTRYEFIDECNKMLKRV